LSDQELIDLLRAGNAEAKDQWYRSQRQRLYATACHFLGYQDPDAEDIVHDTFAVAFESLNRFEGRSSLYTWLNGICVNLCFARIRKRKRQVSVQSDELERLVGAGIGHIRRDEAAQRMERLAKLSRWLESLGALCREILHLRMVEELALVEIKDKLQVPLGTVAARLSRCQKSLRTMALKEGGDA
jgi:RNA polymerase sigma-70 factor (ECF subfamily)